MTTSTRSATPTITPADLAHARRTIRLGWPAVPDLGRWMWPSHSPKGWAMW